jgi:hypothetical protein
VSKQRKVLRVFAPVLSKQNASRSLSKQNYSLGYIIVEFMNRIIARELFYNAAQQISDLRGARDVKLENKNKAMYTLVT